MLKIITATLFTAAIEVDEQGKIIKAPKRFENCINHTLIELELALRREKFQRYSIQDVEE